MAPILVVIAGVAGFVLALAALIVGLGPLAALAVWSGSGLVLAMLLILASLAGTQPEAVSDRRTRVSRAKSV